MFNSRRRIFHAVDFPVSRLQVWALAAKRHVSGCDAGASDLVRDDHAYVPRSVRREHDKTLQRARNLNHQLRTFMRPHIVADIASWC